MPNNNGKIDYVFEVNCLKGHNALGTVEFITFTQNTHICTL